MCYSAMIEADLRKLESRFGAKIDLDNLQIAFHMRDVYKSAMIPSAIDSFVMQNADNAVFKRLAKLAKAHYAAEIEKFSTKLKKHEQAVKDFETKIKSGSKAKGLKESLEKRRETVEWHKEKIAYYEKIEEAGAPRVFPNFYAPVIVKDAKQASIRLMRYQLCPKSGKELNPFKYNLFNARRDRLLESTTWEAVFGKQHGIFPFYRFYESVEGKNGEAKSIYFEPEHEELMWAASLFEKAKIKEGDLWSFAAITDEPPPEVAAAGHDRCPVYIQESNFEKWLNPNKSSKDELLDILSAIEKTYFAHHAA